MLTCATLAGCAAHPQPIIDRRGVDPVAYERNLADCSSYSEQIEVAAGVSRAAVAGAAVSAVRGDAGRAADVGAVSGGAGSALAVDRDRQKVVKRCLRVRGYRVLD